MVFPLIFAAASVAVSAASAVASHQGQQQNSKAHAAHQGEVNRVQAQHRDDLAHWQNRVWEQDLGHAREVLAFARDDASPPAARAKALRLLGFHHDDSTAREAVPADRVAPTLPAPARPGDTRGVVPK